MTQQVTVCSSDYLAADDIPAGKQVGITIEGIEAVPEMPGRKKKGTRKNKEVLITRGKGKKALIANPTNQWAIALLLGTKDWREWIGKRVLLQTDIDVDIETQERTRCIRVAGSTDATPERQAEYQRAWKAGRRERGELCRRLKRAYRMLAAPVLEEESRDVPHELPDDSEPEPPPGAEKDLGDFEVSSEPLPTEDANSNASEPKRMREPGEEG